MKGGGRGIVLVLASSAVIGTAAAMAAAALPTGVGPLCGPACLERRGTGLLQADGSLAAAVRPQARDLIRRELALSPFNTAAWLRLAAIETDASHGRLTGAGNDALGASYRYAPINPEVALWRTAFVFNHWREARPDVRQWAEREVRLLSERDPRPFVELIGRIRDPSGALAYRLLIGDDEN